MQGPANDDSLSDRELASHLASALGETKALEVVRTAARQLKLSPERMDRAQALQVLEAVAKEPGLIGITARFVKSRLILKWGEESLILFHAPNSARFASSVSRMCWMVRPRRARLLAAKGMPESWARRPARSSTAGSTASASSTSSR